MESSQFIDIPEMDGLLNSYSATTNQPFVYKIPVTYLENLSPNRPMIIDSCSNIVIQARNNNHIRVNNKMGIGLDPSSAYSLHVLGDVCISGNIFSNNLNDIYNILDNFIFGTGYCGTITLFNKSIYDISFRVSWNPGSLSQGQEYVPNYVSVNSIDGSTNYIISKFARLADRSSKLFLNTKLDYNSFVNESLVNYSYVNIQLNNSLVTSISSEFFDNDSKHRITVDISNFDNIENIPITINYNPLYKGFFGTFRIVNKTSGVNLDYSYNYINISGSIVNIITSIIQTLSGSDFSNILINSNSRLANQNTPLNLFIKPQIGYDISTNALVANIIGISNNILTSARLFDNSVIYYNYNIIPLTSQLVNGTLGLSFELYRTGFFGTLRLANQTSSVNLDYSYNYISISSSNVTSGLKTLSGSDFSNILINSNSRVAFPNTPLNLFIKPQLGYDISTNALVANIIGISNNILASTRLFDNSVIYYNYNIISLTSQLINGTLGLSFELYRTGFFGTFTITNNGGSTIDYSYNYVTLGGSTIYVPFIPITNSSSNTRTISGELRLRDASNQIAMNIRTASSVADINNYSITGGTINNFVINSISPYKYYNFNILPNVNNLVNGTLTFNVAAPLGTGFYGRIIIYNRKLQASDIYVGTDITYTIYAINGTTQTVLKSATTIPYLVTNPDPPPDLNKLDIALGSRLSDSNTIVRIVSTFSNTNASYTEPSVIGATRFVAPGGSFLDLFNIYMTINSDRINDGTVTVEFLTY